MIFDFIKPITVIIKFSFVLLSSAFFLAGMILNNEPIVFVTGVCLIAYMIYRKFNQIRLQYKLYKQIPESIRNMILSGNLNLKNMTKDNDDNKRGYV